MDNDEMSRAPVCVRVQGMLLTAELNELRGAGDSEVAAHVRECLRCRAAAQRILQGYQLLAARLDSALPMERRSSSAWPVWFSLPIAAILAGLVVLHERNVQLESIPRVGSLQSVKRPVDAPVVNVPADRNVAVFKAENITVVWDLGTKEGS